MAINEVRLNQIGMVLKTTIKDQDGNAINLSLATSQTLILEAPSGTRKEKTSSYVTDGSNGQFQYSMINNDLDELGIWEYQWIVVKGGIYYYTDFGSFEVKRNL